VQRSVIVVFVHAVTLERYNNPPLFVSCAAIVIGILPKLWVMVKSVFAAPGVVPLAFQHWIFLPGSLFVIVSPKLTFPASTREWLIIQSCKPFNVRFESTMRWAFKRIPLSLLVRTAEL